MNIRIIALTALALAAFTAPSLAETFVKGVVQKVDAKTQKLTIAHEDLVDLDMPAMTMVFAAGDASMIENLKEGDKIEFVAERVNGRLTVTKLK
ncbi:MAG: copper-binding protein [Pseudomonadota bacterium]|nr:copper-binding protein [Pseudomonadota bacterium]